MILRCFIQDGPTNQRIFPHNFSIGSASFPRENRFRKQFDNFFPVDLIKYFIRSTGENLIRFWRSGQLENLSRGPIGISTGPIYRIYTWCSVGRKGGICCSFLTESDRKFCLFRRFLPRVRATDLVEYRCTYVRSMSVYRMAGNSERFWVWGGGGCISPFL